MSLVRIVEQSSYDKNELRDILPNLLDWLPLEEIKDKKILIFFDFPEPNLNLLLSIRDFLIDASAKEVSFGSSLLTSKNREGVAKNLEELGLIFHNFRDEPYEEFQVDLKSKKEQHFIGYSVLSPAQYQSEKAFEKTDLFKVRTLKKVFIPYAISSSDYVVFVTKMKDSAVSKIGGFINSLLFVVPTNLRSEIFIKNLSFKFADALLDVFGVLKNSVLFGIVDGIDTDLTHQAEVDKYNLLLSSNDLLALDSVISVLVGFKSSDIETNKMGSIYELGHGLLKEVVIDGVDFIKLRKDLVNKLKFRKAFSHRAFPSIKIQDKKTLEEVQTLCPTGAIEKNNNTFNIERSKCIKCNFCIEIAPDAFEI